jgi:hypothetical protein
MLHWLFEGIGGVCEGVRHNSKISFTHLLSINNWTLEEEEKQKRLLLF